MRWLPWVGGGLVVFLLLAAPQCWSPSGGWEADRDDTMAEVEAREALADAKIRHADSLESVANRRIEVANRTIAAARSATQAANSLRDSVLALGTPPDTCAPWVGLLRREGDSLRSVIHLDSLAYDTLARAVVDLRLANVDLRHSDSLSRSSVDSLTALVRRTPARKWWVPEAQVGYGAVVSDGAIRVGPGLQAGFRVRF